MPDQPDHQAESFSRINIAKGSVVVYLERVLVLGLSFATSVLLARLLSEHDFGIYRLAIGLTTLATYIVGLGLESVVSRFIPEFLAKNQGRMVAKTYGSVTGIRLLALFLLLALLFTQRHAVGTLLKAQSLFDDYYWIAAVYVAARLLSSVAGRAVLSAFGERYLVGYVTIGVQVLTTSLLALAVIVGDGIHDVVGSLAIASGIELVVYMTLVLPRIRRKLANADGVHAEKLGESSLLRRMLPFGVYNFLWERGQVFREYAADSYIIALYADPEAVAYYGIASVIPQLMRSFSPGRMLSDVIMPEFVRQFTAGGSGPGLRFYFRLLNKLNMMVYVPLMVGFLGLADFLIPSVYGAKYAASVAAAMVLIGLTIGQSAADPYYLLSQVTEMPQLVFYSSVWGIYNLVADFLLVPRYGILGAAIATGSSGVLIFVYFLFVIRRKLGPGFGLPWGSLARVGLNCVPLIVAMVMIHFVGPLSVLGLLGIVAGGVGYLAALSVNGVISLEERKVLIDLIPIRIPLIL